MTLRDTAAQRDHYLAELDAFAAHRALAGEPAWLLGVRRNAAALLAERGFPTSRDEEWKYTNVAPIVRTPFRLAERTELSARELASEGVDLWDGPQLVFVNGFFAAQLSNIGTLPPGVRILPIGRALADPECAAVLQRELARPFVEGHGFTALASAFMTDGALVHLGARAVLPRPVHLVFATVASGDPALVAVRNIVVAGALAQGTVVETYLSIGPGKPGTFTAATTHLILAESAVVRCERVQREGIGALAVTSLQAHLERDASLAARTFTLGGALVRNDVGAILAGEGAQVQLDGLYVASGDQRLDTRTVVDHARPHGASRQTYKGIVDGTAHGTFNGKIVVRPGARKTDARQTNQNLQLARTAVVNTKPQLEIYNDDVKCAHGATIGQLDADALFYLRSRGLGLAEARALLVYAFASEIVDRAQVPAVRAAVQEFLLGHLPLAPGREVD